MRVPKKATIIFDYGNGITDYSFDLQELYDIIKEKNERIDRAIKYIENNSYGFNEKYIDEISFSVNVLLDILKGSDTNE